MKTVTVARFAMATRFEMVLRGPNEAALRAAAESALDEIDRVEARLSLYRKTSWISNLNARAGAGPVRVDPELFAFLQEAQRLHRLSDGAFDLTMAPLMRCWGFTRGSGHPASAAEVEAARQVTGMHLVRLDPGRFRVSFERPGVSLDPGAIGKGYAIECAVEVLLEAGVRSGLVHGGTSTVRALGSPLDAPTWNVALPDPGTTVRPGEAGTVSGDCSTDKPRPLAVVSLCDNAVSVSGIWGKAFESEGRIFGHVLDPRCGQPVQGAVMSAVVTDSATDADALSTALLVLGVAGQEKLHAACPSLRSLVATPRQEEAGFAISIRGEGWNLCRPEVS